MRTMHVVLVLLATATSCTTDPASPGHQSTLGGDEMPLRTDRAVYTARVLEETGGYRQYGFTVEVEFRNPTSSPVWLGRCNPDSETPIFGVQAVDADEAAYDAAWACVGHDEQFMVLPGGLRRDVLTVRGPNAWGGCTVDGCRERDEHHGVLEGRFRLHYDVQLCPGDCYDPAPEEVRFSNDFVVRIG